MKVFYRKSEAIARNPLPRPQSTLDRDDYKEVAAFEAADLEEVFMKMNVVDGKELPSQLGVRSMMSGDAVEDAEGQLWHCAMVGWEKVTWKG